MINHVGDKDEDDDTIFQPISSSTTTANNLKQRYYELELQTLRQ
jgi:hypothetical protein